MARGEGKVVLVPGHSGVGKTSLVHALRAPVKQQNGFLLEGKFNQYEQNIPYSAIRDAFAILAAELRAGTESRRDNWAAQLRQATRGLGRLLIELVPDFEPLLGPQTAAPDISPLEARYRFAGLVRNVLRVVCQPEHPVVLFVDDWQWADTASLELLRNLEVGSTLRYFLVIAAYRNNEVGPDHPLTGTIEELRRQAVPVDVIEVRDLTAADVRFWVKNLLQPAADNPDGLADLIHSRTGGNPFFTRALLAFLIDSGLLYLDNDRRCWFWKAEAARDGGMPGNVVALFRDRILGLEPASRDLLSRAACLGNRFDLESLAVIGRRHAEECRSLCLGLPEIVVPIDENAGDSSASAGRLMFVHDRVQYMGRLRPDCSGKPGLGSPGDRRVIIEPVEPRSIRRAPVRSCGPLEQRAPPDSGPRETTSDLQAERNGRA